MFSAYMFIDLEVWYDKISVLFPGFFFNNSIFVFIIYSCPFYRHYGKRGLASCKVLWLCFCPVQVFATCSLGPWTLVLHPDSNSSAVLFL